MAFEPKEKDEQKKEYMTIKIPKPKNMERIFYMLIIIILLFFLFVYNPFPQITCKGFEAGDLTAAAVINNDSNAAEESAEAEVQAEIPVVEQPTPTETPAPAVEKPKETPKPAMTALEGEINYKVTNIVTEIKNKGTANEFGKINEVKYLVENNKEVIKNLRIEVYAYDAKSISDEITLVRGEVSFSVPLEKGEKQAGTIKLKTGSFKDITTEKTVKLRFYDGYKQIKTLTEIVKIK